jgi:DNA adenine methylase
MPSAVPSQASTHLSAYPARPLLRWAGSKRNLLPKLTDAWSGRYDRYVEPFAGSACLFFHLQPGSALLNDINGVLISFFSTVRDAPALVHQHYSRLPASKEFYLKIRKGALFEEDAIRRAAYFVFLNRNCFNGLFRTNRYGEFNVPFSASRTGRRLRKVDFLTAAEVLSTAALHSMDFEAFLLENVKKNDFVYLDPPYAVGNRRIFRQYGPDSFGLDDLRRLERVLDIIENRGAHFLLSYGDCSEARQAFKKYRMRRALVYRNISGFVETRRRASELIFTNIPEMSA